MIRKNFFVLFLIFSFPRGGWESICATVNAYEYYEKALKVAIEGKKYKNVNIKKYNSKMEKAIKFIKLGNKKCIYYPPKESIMRMGNEEYERKSSKSEKLCRISLEITGGVMEIARYLVNKWENIKEEEIWRGIYELEEYVKFIDRVIFSSNPPPLFIKLFFVGGLCLVLKERLIPLFKKLNLDGEVKMLEEYNQELHKYYEIWRKELKNLYKSVEKSSNTPFR